MVKEKKEYRSWMVCISRPVDQDQVKDGLMEDSTCCQFVWNSLQISPYMYQSWPTNMIPLFLRSYRVFEGCTNFSSIQLLSCVWLFGTPWTTAHKASLSITNSQSPPKPMSIESVMPSNHLILCHPLLLLSSIFPSIRVFSNESALHIRWPKYWSFSFSISPSKE